MVISVEESTVLVRSEEYLYHIIQSNMADSSWDISRTLELISRKQNSR
jgi:hypothetical protein